MNRQKLTKGQGAVLVMATIPMIAVGAGGAIGTYANSASVLHREETALGVVAAGEGATLVAALVMLGLTMLGQGSPLAIRAALWLLPAAASVMGVVIAPTLREAVVFGITPLAMTVSAEGLGLLARRIVVHQTGVDVEAQRRNAATLRRIAYLQARAARHPSERVQKWSTLAAWRLMSRVGEGDTELGSGLIDVQRQRLTDGADAALRLMLNGAPESPPALPMSREPEREPHGEPGEPEEFEAFVDTALTVSAPHPAARTLPSPQKLPAPADLPVLREPVLSPAEPVTLATSEPTREPDPEPVREPSALEPDERERQIADLIVRLKRGERLTKGSTAELLDVSPATAGRRLKEARDRLTEGTGMYL
ncbi:hypothetical protein [Streptomyces chumphonensis]|uniref:hypothetical protein n=1 Tax=Streptomyces chumphonensis TaxID=1214925 RepID=UPI003D750EF1